MILRPLFLVLFGLGLALSGCSNSPVPDSPPAAVAAAHVAQIGPPSITLYTMISNATGNGAHSSILINADQRVIFDPAGSVRHETIIERGDVIFGVTEKLESQYTRAHARSTYHVVIQHIPVSQSSAQKALQLALASGHVPSAFCANATARLLRQLPEFAGLNVTFFPNTLRQSVADITGIEGVTLYEDDDADKAIALAKFGG